MPTTQLTVPKITNGNEFKTSWKPRLLFLNHVDIPYNYVYGADDAAATDKVDYFNSLSLDYSTSDDSDNLALTFDNKYTYSDVSPLSNRTIYNKFYKEDIELNLDNNAYLVTVKVKLGKEDIRALDFSKRIYLKTSKIGGGVFRINSIKKYVPDGLSTVELIKLNYIDSSYDEYISPTKIIRSILSTAEITTSSSSSSSSSSESIYNSFASLVDTPTSYSGNSGLYAAVNAAESGLEFIPASGDVTQAYVDGSLASLNTSILNYVDGSLGTRDNSIDWLLENYISNHNDLNNIQGGTADEYYHLTSDEYNNLNEKIVREVTQTSHGFDNDFIYYDGSDWVKAIATGFSECATHFAQNIDTNTFKLISIGEIDSTGMTDDDSSTLSSGYYYLSQTDAGKVTVNKPSMYAVQSVLIQNEENKASISIQEPYLLEDDFVSGPDGVEENTVALFDTSSGKLIKESTIYYDDGSVGINNPYPGYTLDVSGNFNITGSLYQNGEEFTSASSYLTRTVTQTSHGFDNDFVYYDGSDWVKAIASDFSTSATHFAQNIDTNTFNLIPVGEIDSTGMNDVDSSALISGNYYFLSDSSDGKITVNKPTSGIIQSVLIQNEENKASISIQEPYQLKDDFVSGPDIVIDNTMAVFDGSSGKLIKSSTIYYDNEYTLDVSGNLNIDGSIFQNGVEFTGGGSSLWTQSGDDIYYNDGYVGIGLVPTNTMLEVYPGSDTKSAKFYGSNSSGVRATIYANDATEYSAFYGYDEATGTYTDTRIGGVSSGKYLEVDGGNGIVNVANSGTDNAALVVTNDNGYGSGTSGAIVAQFVGDSDSIQIINNGQGDYFIGNPQQYNGINIKDGTGGVEILYNGTKVQEWDSGGGTIITGNVTASNFILSSDIRLKENIKPITKSNIDDVELIEFNFINDSTNRKRYGVIAQELEKVHPEMVYTNSNGFKQVGYTEFLIKKVHSLEERLKKLEKLIK